MWYAIAGALLFLCLLFLFLIFPSRRRHPDLKRLDGAMIAHRGLHDQQPEAPENSLAACRLAVKAGYPIENDIHITADGEVVVFHDDTLQRLCGREEAIEDMTLAQLRDCTLAGSSETIPTLREFLDAVDGRVDLLIEFKCGKNPCRRLCEEANRILSDYDGKYFIQSFYPQVLSWYRRHRPDVCRGQLSSAFYHDKLSMRVLGCLLTNVTARPDFVSYDHHHAGHISRRLCTLLGAFPVGWTFRSEQELQKHRQDFKTFIFEGFIPSNTVAKG